MLITAVRLACALGTGSAIPIDADHMVTAAHVAAQCPYQIVYRSDTEDVAVIEMPRHGRSFAPISCVGLAVGRDYRLRSQYSVGNRKVLAGSYRLENSPRLRLISGRSRQGNSGGGIFDADDNLVAVLVGDTDAGTLVRDLQDTGLCSTN